jgi:hypothetical protein
MYLNAVANSVILYLHDFYNTILKITQIIYIASGSSPQRKNSGCAPVWTGLIGAEWDPAVDCFGHGNADKSSKTT